MNSVSAVNCHLQPILQSLQPGLVIGERTDQLLLIALEFYEQFVELLRPDEELAH